MADEELTRHFFRLLTVGPEAWNKWKKENPDVHLDFSGHKFEGILTAHLYDLDFSGVDISDAKLMSADLSRTNLSGVRAWGADFGGASLDDADFNHSLLMRANLAGASIQGTDFSGADLSNALCSGVKGLGAQFVSAHLSSVDFLVAGLSTQISRTHLWGMPILQARS